MKPQEIWQKISSQAEKMQSEEAALSEFLRASIFAHDSFEKALTAYLAGKLQCSFLSDVKLRDIFLEVLSGDSDIIASTCADIEAVVDRDPACHREIIPFLYFKGFHALQCYRFSHALWKSGRKDLATDIQSRISRVFSVDIHPGATLGQGLLLDHATNIVIGETTVIDDNVSMLHGVTLGGTGKESGDRHPKIRSCVLLGAGARVLGNIEIGEGAKVGAGSVVLEPVPPHTTVAGVPAKIIGKPKSDKPSLEMDHCI